MSNTHLAIHTNGNGMTVADLKEIVAGWPDTDADGKPCIVVVYNDEGFWGRLRKVEAEQICSGFDMTLNPITR